ncbi:MAG: tyrosine-type recombinase/integrase [Bacteroidota bacterium]
MAKLPVPKFNLRCPSGNRPTLISLVYRYRGQRVVYSTAESIHPDDWDAKRQRPIIQERRPELLYIQRHLDALASHCTDIYLECGGRISTKDFKEELDLRLKDQVDTVTVVNDDTPTFIEFLDLELQDMTKGGMDKNTVKMFRQHCNNIKLFASEYQDGAGFSYDDVDWNLRIEFIDWLAARGFQLAYGNKTLKTLRQFMERARRKKHHSNTSYQGVGWTVSRRKAKGDLVTLSAQELDYLAHLNLTGHLDKVRDICLIGAGTGQRFSDFSVYVPDNFYTTISGIKLLSIISKKTSTPTKVPLNLFPWLHPILEKHGFRTPQMSMQKFNEGLKALCLKAGFKHPVLVIEQYMGRKARVEQHHIEKYKLISSHVCRRSFATNLYRMGYSLAKIMPMTGHATESQLRNYIGIDSERNAEAIAFDIMARQVQNANGGAVIKALGA